MLPCTNLKVTKPIMGSADRLVKAPSAAEFRFSALSMWPSLALGTKGLKAWMLETHSEDWKRT